MDKPVALFTATATAIGGGNGHTETSDGAIRADLGEQTFQSRSGALGEDGRGA
jgi:hypothetical protein